VAEDRDALIEEEIQACRDAYPKLRSILYKALMQGSKAALERGCFEAFSVLDYTYPIVRGFYGGSEATIGDSGHAEEGA